MTRRLLKPVILGLAGAGMLVALGVWQLQRLEWKRAILARIEERIASAPVAIPESPLEARDEYLPVRATGHLDAAHPPLRVLVSPRGAGPGYRLIARFVSDRRPVLVDLGYVPQEAGVPALPSGPVTVTGNLLWPDETDMFTPAPDRDANTWFARDVALMAAALEARSILVVARRINGPASLAPSVRPLPVGTEGIRNDHLEYAITWFALAAGWAGMTALWIFRIRQRSG